MEMKFKLPLLLLACGCVLSVVSCSKDDNNSTETNNPTVKKILSQYVNNTVRTTYTHLADASISLESACTKLQGDKNQSNVDAAVKMWLSARKYWEQSEAFLYGPATIRGIDPHVDSWPLDKTNLDNLLGNVSIMTNFDASYATTNLNGGLLGFHALEYVLFRDGTSRNVADIADNELKYAVGVAGDLKLQCIILEASWAGEANLSAEKQQVLKDNDVDIADNWGNQIINAGETGSQFTSQTAALLEILQGEKGCRGIANEVGNTKITDPVNSGNVLDVESWYSWNSKTDFQDNIRGVLSSVCGGVPYENKRDASLSLLSYIKVLDTTKAAKLEKAITDCIGEDEATGLGTIKYPFRNHLNKDENATAIASCNALVSALDEVCEMLQNKQKN